MSNESQFIAPVGQISTDFVTPSNYEPKEKRKDIQLLNHGSNIGILYGIIDLGSHMESFEGKSPELKRKIKILFEHPQLKQLFYIEDTVQRSTTSSFESTLSMNEKSKVRKLIHAIEGRAIPDKEAYGYNLAKLLGARVNVQIEHTPAKADPTKIYEKVIGVFSSQGLAIPVPFEPECQKLLFFIDAAGNNFMTKNFADLPFYFRKKIMESEEGKRHAAAGGKFAEHPKNDTAAPQGQMQQQQPQQAQQQNVAVPPQAVVSTRKLVLNNPAIPIESWYTQGWTDEMIVSQGHGSWVEQTPTIPNTPLPPASNIPQAPQQNGGLFNKDEKDDLPF